MRSFGSPRVKKDSSGHPVYGPDGKLELVSVVYPGPPSRKAYLRAAEMIEQNGVLKGEFGEATDRSGLPGTEGFDVFACRFCALGAVLLAHGVGMAGVPSDYHVDDESLVRIADPLLRELGLSAPRVDPADELMEGVPTREVTSLVGEWNDRPETDAAEVAKRLRAAALRIAEN